MRFMDIPAFERAIEIAHFDFFVRSRLNQAIVLWPEQAFPLVGYMCWPNDADARAALVRSLRGWSLGSEEIPSRLRQIQADWTRVADIFSLHCDLAEGSHQTRRGGPSIGKAIELAAAQSRGRGSGKANLWEKWTTYKDVAHLVTAATIISADAHERAKTKPFAELGLASHQLQPLLLTLLLPDFALSVALSCRIMGLRMFRTRAKNRCWSSIFGLFLDRLDRAFGEDRQACWSMPLRSFAKGSSRLLAVDTLSIDQWQQRPWWRRLAG